MGTLTLFIFQVFQQKFGVFIIKATQLLNKSTFKTKKKKKKKKKKNKHPLQSLFSFYFCTGYSMNF